MIELMFESVVGRGDVEAVAETVDSLCRHLDPKVIGLADVPAVFDAFVGMQKWIEGAVVRMTARYDEAGAWKRAGARSATDDIARKTGTSPTIDVAALNRGWTEGDETAVIAGVGPVSVNAIRALLSDAFLAAVIKDGVDILNVTHSAGRSPPPSGPRSRPVATGARSAAPPTNSRSTTSPVGRSPRRPASRIWRGSAPSTTPARPTRVSGWSDHRDDDDWSRPIHRGGRRPIR